MTSLGETLVRAGPMSPLGRMVRLGWRAYYRFLTRLAPPYRSPNESELSAIEHRLEGLGIPCTDFRADPGEFEDFVRRIGFPTDYHGGVDGGVFKEKLLEHFVAWKFLALGEAASLPYVDIAACSSPWAKLLRHKGIEAFAIDLVVPGTYSALPYYRREDATRTSFEAESIGSASLQCAYEMFIGNDDVDLLRELARILKPGGRVVVSPLYLHTQDCYYQTPEYFGKPYGDANAARFVRRDTWGVPASRKYSPETLRERVWANALNAGLRPSLHVLRNKREIADGIYLHFILVLEKDDGEKSAARRQPT